MNRPFGTTATRRELPVEYWFYFVPILLTALPGALVKWMLAVARHDASLPNPAPFRRAVSTAHTITPEIFSV